MVDWWNRLVSRHPRGKHNGKDSQTSALQEIIDIPGVTSSFHGIGVVLRPGTLVHLRLGTNTVYVVRIFRGIKTTRNT